MPTRQLKIKIGICGCGRFSACFVPLFQHHPLVDEIVLADLIPERVEAFANDNGIERTVSSFDELLKTDVDAVAIFTQRQFHGAQTIQALEAGKHVYSAVPMGMSEAEISAIAKKTAETGLLYMTGETSYYYPSTLFCRDKFTKGEMGKFVYAEAQYLHDMDHFYASFQHSGGKNWKEVAGVPPMYYPTHSTSMILSVTNAKAETVSCLGYVDKHEDGIFRKGANLWDNEFSNECALIRTSDGGIIRINEMRRIGVHAGNSVNMSFYGEDRAYEETALSSCYTSKAKVDDTRDNVEDITELLSCSPTEKVFGVAAKLKVKSGDEFYSGVSSVHPVDRLPKNYKGLHNGHSGSHQFLVDDFITGLTNNTLPPCHAWNSARWNMPGIIAHESAKQEGKVLRIPDLGDVPADYPFIAEY